MELWLALPWRTKPPARCRRTPPLRTKHSPDDQREYQPGSPDALEQQAPEPLRVDLSQHAPPQLLGDVSGTFQDLALSRVDLDHSDPGGQLEIAVLKDRKSTRLNSSHDQISYAVFCLKKKKKKLIIIP